MALLFKDPNKISAYRDRRFPGTQEEYEHALQTSTTVYIGNMSFYTTEEQFYEYYSREDTEDAVKYISGTILDDRPIRVDFDWGFQDGRQWGRGRSGGQVRDEYRTDYDPDILFKSLNFKGGYGKLVQKELEEQRQVVDYGVGSLGSFQPPHMAQNYGRHEGGGGGGHGYGGSHRHGRGDYHRKRYRDDDRRGPNISHRNSENESRRNSDHESKQEKNPRFREHGDSDDEEDDRKRQK
ncbi:hypothetical protein M8C21_020739 [Ambrosia artemisiifolia]|uniref:Nuclear cap-binding protein subunit 2 n=1 Tax=Ambrosia artemisiifolia TaxID=4212 RepID=A0AAD5GPJ1_AMBAR|nr:hypothetical protein M8C21_020739 [Ambrosia artemisiifolia]